MKKLIYSLALTGTICLGMASQASATNLQTIALQQKDSYAVSDDSISTYDFTRDYTDYYYIKEDYQKVMEDVNWDIFNDTSVNVSLKSTEGPSQFSVKVYQKEDGGMSNDDLIPEISKLAKENICFTDNTPLGGADTLYGTTWTVGAMVAQTAGLPLKISIDNNALGEYSVFLEGAYSIGQILEKNGYHNFLLLGSDATFGGRSNLFKQHGNYEIWDFKTALEEKRVSEKIWWGYSDDLLFEYAKEQILNLASKEEPFNFTMLTADTHFPDGYICKDCENLWNEQYKNVISCSSKKVGEFIEWIKQQDFYDNTTIVISGDHLTMQSDFFELEDGQEYDKKVVNVIINSAVQAENTTNRKYSTMDLYPTTLAALGVKIDDDRLALGTNLFSNENTLIEKYGIEYINDELMKTSKFYNSHILVSK